MLGAPEVGKTHLTNQFMSSSDVGTFNQLTGKHSRYKMILEALPLEINFIYHL